MCGYIQISKMDESRANHLLFTVASIINPGHYIMLNLDRKHQSKIWCMEKALSEEMKHDDGREFCDLSPQTYVTVEDPKKERNFKRGVIRRQVNKCVYEVFLIDDGQFVHVERWKIRKIVKENITEIQSLAFAVILYGIIPTKYCNEKRRRRVSQKWCQEAEIFVRKLFSTSNEVKIKKNYVKAGIVYGDIFFKPNKNSSFVSLSKMLWKHEFCLYSAAYFKDVVLNATCEERTAEIRILENLSVPFHCLDNKMIMSSVIELPNEEEEHENTPEGSIRLSTRCTRSIENKSETKTNKGPCEEVTNLLGKVLPENKLQQCVWSEAYGNPLVLFTDSVVKPVNSFREIPISPSVVNNLRKQSQFRSVNSLQRWTIPSICKNHNVVMIGSSKAGKTLSYIISVVEFIQDDSYFAGLSVANSLVRRTQCFVSPESSLWEFQFMHDDCSRQSQLTDGNGPFVVILCSSTQTGRFVYDMCHSLLGNNGKSDILKSKIKIVLVHGDDTEQQIRVKLMNGCHILISTPHCLERILLIPMLTDFERLKCLILDEVDVLTKDPFKSSLCNVLKKANSSTNNRPCQKIFCGKKWTSRVGSLVNSNLKSYITIIASYLEVAIYAKLKPSIYVIDKTNKLDIVLEKIANRIGKFKILVACEKENEANRIYDCLRSKGINSLLAHENLMHCELAEVRSKWSCLQPHPVLIATDGALVELNIKDVQILIHFTIPCKSKTNFFARYSTFLKTIFGNHHFQALKETLGYTDIVLLEYDDVRQFPHIVEYVLRLEGTVAPKALQMYNLIRRRIELDKVNNPICWTLLSFGSCEKWENGENCPYRHAFETSRDSSKNIFADGWVTFVVVKVRDASSFSAKILTHIQPSGKKVKISEQNLQIPERLYKYYGYEHNRKPHGLPKIGDVCSVKHTVKEGELFYRAEIIEFTEVDKYGNPKAVNVRLLDQGDVLESKNIDLYYLPDELAALPPLTVEIKVIGLQPWDYEKVWGNVAVKFAKDVLTKKLKPNQYWSGRIALTLNNTLFLESVILKQFLPSIKCEIVDIVYQDTLLKSEIAVKNTEHLSKLLELCSKGNVEQPKTEGKFGAELASSVVKPNWAFFEKDFDRVKFSSAEKTNIIFLQLKKFENLLIDVELACEEEATNRMRKAGPGLTEDINCLELCLGMYCLALFENRWNRGRVESVGDEDYLIFFVDHGDFAFIQKSDVIPISNNLLQQLPCQAIECSLVGIKEKKEFSKEILDEIYNFSENEQNDLYAYIINKNSEPEITGGRKYIINLLNSNGVSLNKFLVEKKMVEVLDPEKHYLKDIKIDWLEQEEKRLQVKHLEKEISELNVKESSEKSFDVTNLERYLEEMSDDEGAHSFFDEFASRYLSMSAVLSNEPEIKNADSTDQASNKLANFQHSQSEEEEENTFFKNKNKTNSEHSITGPGKLTICDSLRQPSMSPKRFAETEEKFKICNRENILTPKILWFQADGEIKLKIMLDNVENYSLDCTTTNILLRCFLKEKMYVIDLKLYGVVNPSRTTVTIQTFQVVIKLQKLSFPRWPKLHKDEIKYGWINADVENLQDPDEIKPSIKIRSGNVGDKTRRQKGLSRNLLHSFTDSENSETENTNIFNENESENESDTEIN